MHSNEIITILNRFGRHKIPCFFVIDFDLKNFHIEPLSELSPDIFFEFEGFKNILSLNSAKLIYLKKKPIKFETYQQAFQKIQAEMYAGNTYLLNLTFPTEIKLNISLLQTFLSSQAKFKLYFQDEFITFSPERFIKIENNHIFTYPMKGTIDAMLPNAKTIILKDIKEKAEHTMVVDLLRNDLSIVAKKVAVNRFRYLEKIVTNHKTLFQVSSEISGQLPALWQQNLGDILLALLPAGSITGAPKKKTVEIIKTVETYQRGFFTGIFGYFDGQKLDSAVMIRFIEKHGENLVYKSGGGITINSQAKKEYQEMLDKIYVPVEPT